MLPIALYKQSWNIKDVCFMTILTFTHHNISLWMTPWYTIDVVFVLNVTIGLKAYLLNWKVLA